jgi:predicted RNase H-like HicB family nuclease
VHVSIQFSLQVYVSHQPPRPGENEESGYKVTVPSLPECIAQGDIVSERLERAREAIEGCIEVLKASGESVPEETTAPHVLTIHVAA